MKYVLVNDFFQSLKRNKLLLVISLGVFIISAFYVKREIAFNNLYLSYFGIEVHLDNVTSIIFMSFNLLLYFYMGISLYLNELRLGNSFLFSRITFEKWNLYKCISIFFIFLILKIFQYLIFSIINIDGNYFYVIPYIIANFLFLYNITLSLIHSYLFNKFELVLFLSLMIPIYIYFEINSKLILTNWFTLINIVLIVLQVFLIKRKKVYNIVNIREVK